HGGEAGIDDAVAGVVVGDTPFAFGGCFSWSRRVGAGHDYLSASIKQGGCGILLNDGVVPGEDPAHVDGAFGAGLLGTQAKGVAQPQLFGDGEGADIAEARVAVHLGAGTGQHTGQVFHVFHGTHEVAKVIAVGFEAADVDDVHIGEFAGHNFGS